VLWLLPGDSHGGGREKREGGEVGGTAGLSVGGLERVVPGPLLLLGGGGSRKWDRWVCLHWGGGLGRLANGVG